MRIFARKFRMMVFVVALLVSNLYFSGNTTHANGTALTVAQAIANNQGTATVEGYIVGITNNGPYYVFQAPFSVDTNIAIADSALERTKQNILPVQLPSGTIRTGLNLKTNPSLLGKKIRITGKLEAYFGVPGLKSPTSYEILDIVDPDPDPISIVEAKTKAGQTVTVTGVITADNAKVGGGKISTFLQDETAGINVFASNPAGFPELVEGDKVKITGTIQNYRGLTEIMPSAAKVEVLAKGEPVPQPQPITIADLTSEDVAEPKEGTLVQVEAYVMEKPGQQSGGGYNVSILDENYNGTTLRVMPETGVYEQIEAKTWYQFTAVLSQYDSYQLVPRKASDAVRLAEQKPAPKPLEFYPSKILSVVDGDTVHLVTPVLGGTKVRFVNIDTPETYHNVVTEADRSQKEHGEIAKEHLKTLLHEGDEVLIKVATEPFDDYGRLLAQIIRKQDNVNVNLEMVRSGYASTYFIWPIDDEDYVVYSEAVKEAYDAGLGIWNPSNPLMELPFVFRAREQGKGLTRYVGHFRDKYFVDPAEWATIPVEARVFFASPEEAESAGYSRDHAAPTTNVSFSQEPNESGWWNQDVTISLEASDDQSGVSTTEIQIDGGEWTTYQTPYVVSKEGDTIISYRSKDRAGNAEEAKSVTVKLDKTLPVWELTQSGEPVHNILINDSVTLDVKAEDALSGIQSVSAEIDDEKVDLNKKYSALSLGLGSHTIQVTVGDQAGNVGQQSYTFTIDTSLETIHSLVDGLLRSKDIKNKGIATSIKAKLDTIQHFFESGDYEQAKKHLTDLQETLHTYAENGNITEAANELLQSNLEYLSTMENWKL
ncbi:DUF6359 domain-containing protein [Brevibacillus sp. SYSU BS000544]|uniref:DUF6359 domain-containing protein n=1 Tax=Brevibacillus sp. SYSU BS000544 TaxID=3416443 RepID=UPI003CE57FD1